MNYGIEAAALNQPMAETPEQREKSQREYELRVKLGHEFETITRFGNSEDMLEAQAALKPIAIRVLSR